MSDAMKYLMQIRGEAMADYFSFLKKSGSHLDDKTRALISVITKVDKQTEAGFRQYLKRAMNVGASADEIIDALFLAFPTLRLSKIIWAIEILLEMELPEFDVKRLNQSLDWHSLGPIEELESGLNYLENCDGKNLFVYRNEKQFRVYDSVCPHQSTRLSLQSVATDRLICPSHGWAFSLETGQCLNPDKSHLNNYDCKIEDSQLLVFW
ncbi:MAG: Rieske 2Fe-2S domain-containing protein [Gammaproteobacteria bacterium]|nr:Rieske 2Fe-2S domain-containing protein [Gammaproteobacteria bacterium]